MMGIRQDFFSLGEVLLSKLKKKKLKGARKWISSINGTASSCHLFALLGLLLGYSRMAALQPILGQIIPKAEEKEREQEKGEEEEEEAERGEEREDR